MRAKTGDVAPFWRWFTTECTHECLTFLSTFARTKTNATMASVFLDFHPTTGVWTESFSNVFNKPCTHQGTNSSWKFAPFKDKRGSDLSESWIPHAVVSTQQHVLESHSQQSAHTKVHFHMLKCAQTKNERLDGFDTLSDCHERPSSKSYFWFGWKGCSHTKEQIPFRNVRDLKSFVVVACLFLEWSMQCCQSSCMFLKSIKSGVRGPRCFLIFRNGRELKTNAAMPSTFRFVSHEGASTILFVRSWLEMQRTYYGAAVFPNFART